MRLPDATSTVIITPTGVVIRAEAPSAPAKP
jgi:hypothetical protein